MDETRVFLFGFSQGATMSFTTLASTWPTEGLVAGAVLVSGRLLPHMFHANTALHARLAPPQQVRYKSIAELMYPRGLNDSFLYVPTRYRF